MFDTHFSRWLYKILNKDEQKLFNLNEVLLICIKEVESRIKSSIIIFWTKIEKETLGCEALIQENIKHLLNFEHWLQCI